MRGEERRGEERRGAGLSRGKARACEMPAERWRQRSVAAEAERAGREREGERREERRGGERGGEGRGSAEGGAGRAEGPERLPICGRRWAAPPRGTWLARSALASPRRAPAPPPRPGARSPPAPSGEGPLLNN